MIRPTRMTAMRQTARSYRFTQEDADLLKRLTERHGVSETDVLRMALRRMARVDLVETGTPPVVLLDMAAAILEGKVKGRRG